MQERGNRKRIDVPFVRAERTLQEVADMLGITRERVRQVETIALKKMKLLLLEDDQFWELLEAFKGAGVSLEFDKPNDNK
jgi:cobalamin biosynthesis protein CbiG